MKTRRVGNLAILLCLLFGSFLPIFSSPLTPSSVTVAGSLQSELGCPGDWQPNCATTHMVAGADGIYRLTANLPAGSYEYKVAINDDWAENYGKNAAPNGANIVLNHGGGSITFYYSHDTHWITDNKTATIASAPGSYQSEIGCAGDWQPNCLKSWLQDIDGDGLYTFETTAIPAGNYEFKVAINEDWAENYGQGGAPGGSNLTFTVAVAGTKVVFSFNAATKIIGVSTGRGLDNNVEFDGLGHNSQDSLYRQPFGAVNPNTPIKLRFRTFAGDVSGVRARLFYTATGQEFFQGMQPVAKGVACYETRLANDTCDWWETSYTPAKIGTIYYRFLITDGTRTAYYADDRFKDGGVGEPTATLIDNSYVVTVYDPAFKPIPWMQSAVIYQIFPDRFRNGEKSNDPKGTEPRYNYPGASPDAANDKIINKDWGSLPEGYCRKYDAPLQACTEQPRGRDYYGGDLKGVTQKLNYLEGLGVNVLYFNPIFDAGSNHSYDTQDYMKIDPFFGTEKDWDQLVEQAARRDIKIVLDGVFNHVSSDSSYFDRYSHFGTLGACESVSSPYREWFYFRPLAGGPCAGPAGPNTMTYDAWFGFDSLPVLNKNNQQVRDFVYEGNNNVTQYWLKNGAAGWRLDVMGDGSFPDEFWQEFRTAVKKTDKNATIIGELWKKEEILPKIHGDMADTTMNYRFRNAVLGFFGTVDDKGFADDGQTDQPPSMFARKLNSVREDYPDAVYYTLMNIMDSHDTKRILWSLTPGKSNREEKELNAANLAKGKQRLKLATLVQMTIPGAPTIYYGDEVALNGDDDPDDRRSFPWCTGDNEGYRGACGDQDMLAHYRKLISARKQLPELTKGDLKFLLLDDANRTMAYGMRQPNNNNLSIVAINRNETSSKTLQIPLTGYLRNGVRFTDGLTNQTVTSANGFLTVTLPPLGGTLLFAQQGQDLVGPNQTATVTAVAGNGKVNLSWTAVGGSTKYNLYRTQVSGGGYQLVATVTGTSYEDSGLANGKRYYYAVRGLDNAGNEGKISADAGATPSFPIGYAVLQFPKTLSHTKGISPTPDIYGQIYVGGLTDAGGSADSIIAQVGFGATGSDAATWDSWVGMSFNTKAGNNYEYKASLTPEVVGVFDLLVRFSTDGGLTWSYGDQDGFFPGEPGTDLPGVLTVLASSDTTPPSAPGNLRVADWSAGFIKIAWDAVGDAAQYRIYRSNTAGVYDFSKPLAKVPAGTSEYRDEAVGNGTTYFYVVRALDGALNASVNSNEVSRKAEPKLVAVTFRVSVPAETPSSDTVYMPGNIDLLGPWNPGKQALVNKGGGIWEVTLNILDGTLLEYKYTRGSWDRVEWWGSIVSTANRSVSISYGTNGTQLVDNTARDFGTGADALKGVQYWRDPLVASKSASASGVSVNFSQPIQPLAAGNFAGSISVTNGGGAAVAGSVSPGSGTVSTLSWTPGAPLAAGTYTVTVKDVRSNLGGDSVPIQTNYTFTFSVP
jgi:glycosidase